MSKREELEKLQLERLQETVARVYEKVEPYRKKMDEIEDAFKMQMENLKKELKK